MPATPEAIATTGGTRIPAGGGPGLTRWAASHPAAVHVVVLAVFLAAGIGATWPKITGLPGGQVPGTTDAAGYVWDLWWVAHCVTHLHNPWFTTSMAAPVGVRLGFDTLMPLVGLVMAPVTLAFGPAASFTLLVVLLPGLLCYAMYRVARLWLTSQVAAIAAGALFGLSAMLVYQDEAHVNMAAGELFLPMALEAVVRLRRRGGKRRAIALGVVVGAAFLVNQESAALTLILAACALLPWLLRRPGLRNAGLTALALLTGAVIAAPQIIAMVAQAAAGGASAPAATLAGYDGEFGVPAPTLFSPSPRVASFGLTELAKIYQYHPVGEGRPTFGLIVSALAGLGIIVAWRRRGARPLALLWLGSCALALGTVLVIGRRTFVPLAHMWHGIRVSEAMPYTWFVQIPGLSSFREADRIALLGLVPAALLAGAAVEWMLTSRHRVALAAALAFAVLEAGWYGTGTVPAAIPSLDRPIAADHSGSIVVDIPFGLRGGLPLYGAPMDPQSLLLATGDGHPRAISYTSLVPANTTKGIEKHPFYADLVALEQRQRVLPTDLAAARADARRMDVGWVLVWKWYPGTARYLEGTGFRFAYRAAGVAVYHVDPVRTTAGP
jgi:hypothetical protein